MILLSAHSFSSIGTPKYSRTLYQPQLDVVLSKMGQVSHLSTSATHNERRVCECFDLYSELVPYGEAWSWQKSIVKEKKASIERNEDCSDTLIILQHYPVYTLGTGQNDAPDNIHRTERGGEVTYHGLGQGNKN